MKVEQFLHMAGGAGVTSYSNNSRLQEKAISRSMPLVKEAIKDVYSKTLPGTLVVADLGCSSSPNTFSVISGIIEAVAEYCRKLDSDLPEIQYNLNDLPGNDFNTVFKHSTMFEKHLKEELQFPCYVAGVPGSFYERRFPRNSVHFIHSSYCLMWLSQVPQGLASEKDIPPNKGNIYLTETSPISVVKLYLQQFEIDFSTFLKIRSQEMVSEGRMVLTFLGRKNLHATSGELSCLWGLLSNALNSMALEGKLNQQELDNFNLPFYSPSLDEVKIIIRNQGSFNLDQVQTLESNWDPFDDSDGDVVLNNYESRENVANCIRAVIEPTVSKYFGEGIMDDLFKRFAENVGKHFQKEKTKFFVLMISLKKQG